MVSVGWKEKSPKGWVLRLMMMRDVCIINDDKDGLSSHDSMVEMAGTIRME